MRRYLLSEGAITDEFDGEAVPDEMRVMFVARWLNGAATIPWLVENPEWFEWANICAIAHEQAQAQWNADNAPAMP